MTWLHIALLCPSCCVLAKRAAGKPVKLMYDESNFYCNGDDAGTYSVQSRHQERMEPSLRPNGTYVGLRNPIFDKTYECTAIPNLRGTHACPFVNKGLQIVSGMAPMPAVPHGVMMDRVAAELGLDPTEVSTKK